MINQSISKNQIVSCPVCESSAISSFIKTKAQMHNDEEIFNFDQCRECDFVFLNPRVPKKKLKHYYTSYYLPYRGSNAWGKYKGLVEKSQKKLDLKRLKLLKELLDLTKDSVILDIGCGQPSFLKVCNDHSGCHSIGLDFSDEGWKNNPVTYSQLDLKIGEIKNLTTEIQPDVISMWHYLEHDYKPFENLKHLKSISKSNTKLIIEVPNFNSESRKYFGEHWAGWHTPRHTSLFSPKNIELLLNKSGWKVNKLYNHGTIDPYLLQWMSKMEQENISWNKNMEDEFLSFVMGMFKFFPKKLNEKRTSLGIMTVIAEPY
jgi:2-polyprenyl-3-methyl-5-hydroxy-6-metoxy-1,4-benzoquinol methylase